MTVRLSAYLKKIGKKLYQPMIMCADSRNETRHYQDVLGNIDGVIAEIVRLLENELVERKPKSQPPFSKGEIGILTPL